MTLLRLISLTKGTLLSCCGACVQRTETVTSEIRKNTKLRVLACPHMENYTKGEVKELENPFPFQVEDSLQMRVSAGSKIRNLMGFALKSMGNKDTRQITWNGSGQAVTKAITCAEIMKRKLKGLHQITKIRYRRVEEYWTPKVEGLEVLKVNRDIPTISILLSKDPLDSSEPGYQPPESSETFWQERRGSKKTKTGEHHRSQRKSTMSQEIQGLKRKRKKDFKDFPSGRRQSSPRQTQPKQPSIHAAQETIISEEVTASSVDRQRDRNHTEDGAMKKGSMDISQVSQTR